MFYGFNANFWDQYFFDHALNNIALGKGWTLNHTFNNVHFFALHFQPIYYFIALFYFIKATPFWIFLFQSLFLTLSLIPVIKYAKYCFSNKPNVGFGVFGLHLFYILRLEIVVRLIFMLSF